MSERALGSDPGASQADPQTSQGANEEAISAHSTPAQVSSQVNAQTAAGPSGAVGNQSQHVGQHPAGQAAMTFLPNAFFNSLGMAAGANGYYLNPLGFQFAPPPNSPCAPQQGQMTGQGTAQHFDGGLKGGLMSQWPVMGMPMQNPFIGMVPGIGSSVMFPPMLQPYQNAAPTPECRVQSAVDACGICCEEVPLMVRISDCNHYPYCSKCLRSTARATPAGTLLCPGCKGTVKGIRCVQRMQILRH